MAGRRYPGGCEYITSTTRLGSSWSLCNRPAEWRCVLSRGEEKIVQEYCSFHLGGAKRRTRYDKLIRAQAIEDKAETT